MSQSVRGEPSRPTILVVDDDALVRWALTAALSPMFELHVVGTSREALAYIDGRDALDAAIFDVRLPDGSGFGCAKAMARARPGAPFLVLSATPDMRGHAIKVGAADFIEKPFDVVFVVDRVSAAVRGH